jgi:thiol-disulfide isomerase/thioredoxin
MRRAAVLVWLGMSLTVALAAAPVSAVAQIAEPLRTGDMAKIRAAYQGRALLVHVWSLTCAPCLTEMPQWAQRIRQNPGVAFVFINTDGTGHAAAAARRLALSGVKPTRSLVYADDFVERLQYEIAPEWQGELPRTEWVAGNGKSGVTLGPVSDSAFKRYLSGQL